MPEVLDKREDRDGALYWYFRPFWFCPLSSGEWKQPAFPHCDGNFSLDVELKPAVLRGKVT